MTFGCEGFFAGQDKLNTKKMTDYPATRSSWKKHQVQKKWRDLLAAFIVIVLIFAVLSGFIKSLSFKKYLDKSGWDGKGSFVLALSTSQPSVFIYQKDPKRMIFLTVNDNFYLPSGQINKPIVKISSVVEEKDGIKLAKILTLSFGAKIENYVIYKDKQNINEKEAQKMFKNFASPLTPFLILARPKSFNVQETNITRLDALRLWWQVKGLSINQLNLVDLSSYGEEIVFGDSQKVLGVDEVSLNRVIAKYLETPEIMRKNFKVTIRNASGSSSAAKLATDFVTSVGFDVVRVESQGDRRESSVILSGDGGKDSVYLSKLFNCDIVSQAGEENAGLATVVVGADFARKYFE